MSAVKLHCNKILQLFTVSASKHSLICIITAKWLFVVSVVELVMTDVDKFVIFY